MRVLHRFIGLSVCGSRSQAKDHVRERCDGARVRPNSSYPLPLGHHECHRWGEGATGGDADTSEGD